MSDIDTKIFQVRERNRTEIRILQLEKRRDSLDRKRCGLSETSNEQRFTEGDVIGLAGRIKRRKNADEQDLRKLCGAFLQSSEYISTFCKITGALNILMKVFTGTDSDLQLLAGECLCNLSLGEEVCSRKVATTGGSYLILYLHNTNEKLAETCLWTIQNLILSGEKCTQLLLSQGLASALLQHGDMETLAILVHEAWNLLPEDIQTQIPQHFCKHLKRNVGLFGLYESLMGLAFQADPTVLDDALEQATHNLTEDVPLPDVDYVRWILSIRVLTNIIIKYPQLFASVIAILLERKVKFSTVVQRIMSTNNDTLIKEGLWMAGNIFQLKEGSSDHSDLFTYFNDVDRMEENLNIPVEFTSI